MNPSTKDRLEGTLHEITGSAKETLGRVTNNPDLATEGKSEKIAGKVQNKVGQVEEVFER